MERADKRKLLASGTLVCLSLLVVGWWSVQSKNDTQGDVTSVVPVLSGSDAGRSSGGLQPRAVDPAGVPLEWAREGVDVRPPEGALPLHARIAGEEDLEELMGLLQWALPVGQGGAPGREMARCAAKYESKLEERCGWDMTAVLRRQDEETGRLVYLKTTVTLGKEQASCRALASCSSHAWARRDPVPMPKSVGDEVSFSQAGRGSLWHAGMGTDAVTHYRNQAAKEQQGKDALTKAAREPTEVTPSSLGWNILFAEHRIEEFDCMIEVLEDQPEACGA